MMTDEVIKTPVIKLLFSFNTGESHYFPFNTGEGR